MAKEILIEGNENATKVAILEDRELVEYYSEHISNKRITGNIYKGKVQSVLKGMQSAFVDIGYGRNAFLYISDTRRRDRSAKINDILKPGQEVTVQVIKDPAGSKGPRVTGKISLPGRYVVLTPGENYIGISRKIVNIEEKKRLKTIAASLKPKGMGIIIRTVAEGKGEEDLEKDILFLKKLWETIEKKIKTIHEPACIHRDFDLLLRTVRDFCTPDVDRLIVNNKEQYETALSYMELISSAMVSRIKLFDKSDSVFNYYQIGKRMEKALNTKVWLKCGGYLVIEKTEALTVIDVNTGKFIGSKNLEDTVFRTNISAAMAIAKQIRLRDIGGIIIIDFIDMKDRKHKESLINTLKAELKRDRSKTSVMGITSLGLVEMTRKKVGIE